ncbi:MAG: hypothetical protein ACREOC_11260 [Gemmatimonadales bacterium]
MMLEPRVRLSLTPEEGAVLGQLADRPWDDTRFTPTSHDRSGYRAFNLDVVWPLEQLRRRGLAVITQRVGAETGAELYWNAIAAALTPQGREAVAGRPRDSVGQPVVPDG